MFSPWEITISSFCRKRTSNTFPIKSPFNVLQDYHNSARIQDRKLATQRRAKKAKVTTTGVTRSVKVTHPLNTKYTWFDPNERISGHCVINQTMVCSQFPTL